jgi:hypothetical protein
MPAGTTEPGGLFGRTADILPGTEILGCPDQDVCEIDLGDRTEANTPPAFAHNTVNRLRPK